MSSDIQAGDVVIDLSQGVPLQVVSLSPKTAGEHEYTRGDRVAEMFGVDADEPVYGCVFLPSSDDQISPPKRTYSYPASRLVRFPSEAATSLDRHQTELRSRALHTVTAKNHDGHIVTPCLVQYYGNSDIAPIEAPLPTVTTHDRFALVVPEHSPYGLDIRFRMLQPRELAQAMGFPKNYDFAGNKTETVEQIGNAVPVNLAKSLVQALLEEVAPSLFSSAPSAKPGVATDGGEADAE